MRLGETNPISTPTRIGGRALRRAPTGSVASNWRNKANPGRNPQDRFCGVRAGAASADFAFWRNEATASLTVLTAPSLRRARLGKFTKRIHLRKPNEINDYGTIELSECGYGRRFGEAKPPVRTERASARSAAQKSGRHARAPGVPRFAKQSHRAGPRHGSVPPPRPG